MTAGSPKDVPSPESADLVLETALRYIEAGIRVIPVTRPDHPNKKKAGKAPIPEEWGTKPYGAAEFKADYREGMNIGVVTGKVSGIICIDIDPRHGGHHWFNRHQDDLGNYIEETTGDEGGRHLYYRYPDGVEWVSSWGKEAAIAPGVDVKADGGQQVVTWPSVHHTGVPYVILRGFTLEDVRHEADPPPAWLMEIIGREKPKRERTRGKDDGPEHYDGPIDDPADVAAVTAILKEAPPAIEGRCGDFMTLRVGFNGWDHALSEQTTLRLMTEHYNPRCLPPWSRKGLEEKIHNSYRYAHGEFGARSVARAFAEPAEDHTLSQEEQAKQEREIIGELKFALKRPIMCAELILNEMAGRMKAAKDVVYLYDDPDQVWRILTETEVKSHVLGFVKERDQKTYQLLKPSKLKEIADTVRVMLEGEKFRPVENAWITAAHGFEPFVPANCVRMANGILDLTARRLLPHSSDWFSMTKLPFDYNPEATCPEFAAFLQSIWGSDNDIKDCLRLWMGYLLLSDVKEQKFALLIGASRAGKGILSRVMERMIGPDATVGCTLSAMANDHGLPMLVGKRLVVFGDVVKAPGNVGEIATERLISIIGQDPQVINRKFLDPYSSVLPVKIVMACNEFPLFMNSRQALTNRMLVFPFTESFAGKEDPTLDDRLQAEVSGILNWALEGAARLLKGERLRMPAKADETFREIRKKMDSVLGFVEECVQVHEFDPWDPECRNRAAETVAAYRSYQTWCKERGHAPKNMENFIAAAIAYGDGNVSKDRIRRGVRQVTVLLNFELTDHAPGVFN